MGSRTKTHVAPIRTHKPRLYSQATKAPRQKAHLPSCSNSTCQHYTTSSFPHTSYRQIQNMAVLSSSLSAFFIKKLVHPSKPTSIFSHYSTHPHLSAMNFPPRSKPGSAASATTSEVPDLPSNEMGKIVEQTFQRYSSSDEAKRNGSGVAIVWFRNDLRVLDNEALVKAWASSQAVLPVYCVDPRLFGTTHYFGFPKTGGTHIIY